MHAFEASVAAIRRSGPAICSSRLRLLGRHFEGGHEVDAGANEISRMRAPPGAHAASPPSAGRAARRTGAKRLVSRRFRREMLVDLEGLDEGYHLYGEDIDLAWPAESAGICPRGGRDPPRQAVTSAAS
jgi:hypothetical protein